MTSAQIDEPLMTALYDSAVYGGNWHPALVRLRALLHSAETALVTEEGAEGACTGGGWLSPQLRQSYAAHYAGFDPKNPLFARKGPGFLFNDVDHFDEAFVARDVFYQEFSRPQGSRHTLDLFLDRIGDENFYLAAMRTRSQGPYDAKAEALLRQAGHHFLQAAKLIRKMEFSQLLAASARAALDSMRFGVVVLDANERVAMANHAAEEATAPGEPLQLRQQRFVARSARVAPDVDALIRGAMPPCGTAGALRAHRPDGSAWSVWVAPLPANTSISAQGGPGALILIGKSQADAALRREDLSALYGLTCAEAELALRLARGLSLAEAAGERGVKLSTARSQLLAILQKTGARGQAELVRMLTLLPGAALRPGA
jgi:DNA-binding CsgD family transcriptional regulator/PAS domain-containing protein